MAASLGYGFNKTQIKNGTYSPVAHGRIEEAQEQIRELTVEVLQGERALPMNVMSIPSTQQPEPVRSRVGAGDQT